MRIEIGEVEALFRYPVKSMSGELLEVANLGWHGLDGDRRLALCRTNDRSGFPWLTASKLPELILFAPQRREGAAGDNLPTHVRKAGVYGTTTSRGRLAVGQPIFFEPAPEHREIR